MFVPEELRLVAKKLLFPHPTYYLLRRNGYSSNGRRGLAFTFQMLVVARTKLTNFVYNLLVLCYYDGEQLSLVIDKLQKNDMIYFKFDQMC